jgi:hypothetical protein
MRSGVRLVAGKREDVEKGLLEAEFKGETHDTHEGNEVLCIEDILVVGGGRWWQLRRVGGVFVSSYGRVDAS